MLCTVFLLYFQLKNNEHAGWYRIWLCRWMQRLWHIWRYWRHVNWIPKSILKPNYIRFYVFADWAISCSVTHMQNMTMRQQGFLRWCYCSLFAYLLFCCPLFIIVFRALTHYLSACYFRCFWLTIANWQVQCQIIEYLSLIGLLTFQTSSNESLHSSNNWSSLPCHLSAIFWLKSVFRSIFSG